MPLHTLTTFVTTHLRTFTCAVHGISITDVSDYPWNPLSSQPVHGYTRNTTALLSTLLQHVPHVALSSQGMLGEGIRRHVDRPIQPSTNPTLSQP